MLLLCARHADLVTAGVSLFGVTDLFDLAATTHRFESRYLDRLVGLLPRDADRYRDRSPVTHAADIAVPLLVLQGADDKVVPRAQADALVETRAATRFEMRGREMRGWVRVAADDVGTREALAEWVDRGVGYASSLPPKQ